MILDKQHAKVNVNPPNSRRTKQILYCICQKPDDGNTYVECGQCMEWYHPKCVGFQESKAKSLLYVCFKCLEKDLMNMSASLLDESITKDDLLSEDEELDDLSIPSNDQRQSSLCTKIVELEEMVMKKQTIISTQEDKITQLKNDLKLKRTEIGTKECEIVNQHGKVKSLEKENKKVSKSVETTLTQFSRLRKENAKMKEDLQVKEGRIEALQSTIKSMEKVNQHLEKENEAHVNLVQSMTELPVNSTRLGGVENNTETKGDTLQPGLTLGKLERSENKKLAEKSSEIKNLKNLIIVLEDAIKDTQAQRDDFQHKLFVAECEVEREKTLVNVLIKFSGRRMDGKTQAAGGKGDETKERNTEKKGDEKRNGGENTYLVLDSWELSQNQTKLMDDSKNGEKGEVCEQTFLHGKAACTNKKCKKMHKLDFVKIRRGICYKEFEETGSCKRSKCWFSHQVPGNLKVHPKFIGHVRKERQREKENNKNKYSKDRAMKNANQNNRMANISTDEDQTPVNQHHQAIPSSKLPQNNPEVQSFLQLTRPMIQQQIGEWVEEKLTQRK